MAVCGARAAAGNAGGRLFQRNIARHERTGFSGLPTGHTAAGKLPKVVIVAVMRKMITMLNAMVRDDVVWADRLSGRHVLPT